MRKAIVLLFVLTFQNIIFATPQARDVLFWNDNTYFVFPFIDIESHLSTHELENLNKLKNTNPPTGNYRGYSFEFAIKNDTLFLLSVKDTNKTNLTESVFGDQIRRPLFFFSDTLYLGYGQSFYEDGFWTPIYESEITVVFKNGVVQWFKDNQNKTKHSPYTYNPKLFWEFVYSEIQWDNLDTQTLRTKPDVILNCEIDSIANTDEVNIIRSSGYVEFDREAVRVIKSIPSFSVSFVKGKYLRHSYTYRIVFDIEKARRFRRMGRR